MLGFVGGLGLRLAALGGFGFRAFGFRLSMLKSLCQTQH